MVNAPFLSSTCSPADCGGCQELTIMNKLLKKFLDKWVIFSLR